MQAGGSMQDTRVLGFAPGRLRVVRENGSLRSVLPPHMRKRRSTATHAHGRLPDEPASTEYQLDADVGGHLPPSGRRLGRRSEGPSPSPLFQQRREIA